MMLRQILAIFEKKWLYKWYLNIQGYYWLAHNQNSDDVIYIEGAFQNGS